MEIQFEPVFDNLKPDDYRIPMNYLPFGLEVLNMMDDELDKFVGLVVPLDLGALDEGHIPVASVTHKQVANPEDLNKAILKRENDILEKKVVIAPNLIRRIDETRVTERINFIGEVPFVPANRAVIVIDLGIAFWNAQFGDHFVGMSYLSDTLQIKPLSKNLMADIKTDAMRPGGNMVIIDKLAKEFNDSFFAGNVDMHALWHGTAIADLASRPERSNGNIDLYGIELPRSVLLDSRGDRLKTALSVALRQAEFLVSNMDDGTIVNIVLGFGFPSGPHVALRPDIQQITDLMGDISAKKQVHLLLPAGNHLQDKCHARLPANGSEVVWRIPPDDSSTNSIDLGYLNKNPLIGLETPDGASGSVTPEKGWVYNILLDGELIGRLHSLPELMNGWYQIRLALFPTANRSGRSSVPFGNWKIGVNSIHESGLWILRDDNVREFGEPGIQIPSAFHDPCYRETDEFGAPIISDNYDLPQGCTGPSKVRRSGTASLLTLAEGGRVKVASALECHSGSHVNLANYSGRAFDGTIPGVAILVDDLSAEIGVEVIGNGSNQTFRFTGTSAAVGLLRP